MQDLAFLISNGVPYSEVLRMSPTRRMAMCVAIGEHQGGQFDWHRMRWEERKT